MSMNYVKVRNARDLDLIFREPFLLTGDARKHDQETEHNMWAIACAYTKTLLITKDILMTFVISLQNAIIQQLQNSNSKFQVTLYVWFDEMAGQLRFNIVSGKVTHLPFGCTIAKVASPESIIQSFLSSPYLYGIPADEVENVSVDDDQDDDEKEYILPVYVDYIDAFHNYHKSNAGRP